MSGIPWVSTNNIGFGVVSSVVLKNLTTPLIFDLIRCAEVYPERRPCISGGPCPTPPISDGSESYKTRDSTGSLLHPTTDSQSEGWVDRPKLRVGKVMIRTLEPSEVRRHGGKEVDPSLA